MWQQSSGKSVTGVNNLCFSCQIDSMFQSQIHLASFGFMVDSVASWSDRFHESFWRDFGFMVNNVASFSQILDQLNVVCTFSKKETWSKNKRMLSIAPASRQMLFFLGTFFFHLVSKCTRGSSFLNKRVRNYSGPNIFLEQKSHIIRLEYIF